MNRVIFVSGSSNSGKTTLIEMLIPRLRRKGLRVGTIKHAHQGCEIDQPGKDSWRHAEAGASAVTVVAPNQTALLVQTEKEMALGQAIQQMAHHADLILAEGYKGTQGSKILLEPEAGKSIEMDDAVCRIGVQVDKLSSNELDQIVAFLLKNIQFITVQLVLFAQLKELFGEERLSMTLPKGSTGHAIIAWLLQKKSSLERLLQVSRLAVNCEYVSWDHVLQHGDEVALILPVSGG